MKCFLILFLIFPLVLTSKLVELQIKTRDVADAGMNGFLSFNICTANENICCTIIDIDSSLDNFEPGHLDDFTAEQLPGCYGMEISENENFRLIVFHRGSDAWFGQYIRLLLDSGIYFQCPVTDWMDDDESKIIDCTIGIPNFAYVF